MKRGEDNINRYSQHYCTKIYFASRANATIPAAKGAAADVPV